LSQTEARKPSRKPSRCTWKCCCPRISHLVEKLLEIDGIDPNFGGHSQKPPLALAAKNGHSAVVELLLAAVNIDADIITDQNDITPLCYAACAQPYYPAVGRNIQTSCTRFNLAYASRCQDGHISIVKQLLAQEDVDPNFQSSKDGSTALMLASKHPDIIKLLLDHKGIDVNRQDHLGCTALLKAVSDNCLETVKLLLERKDINSTCATIKGHTPLFVAGITRRVSIANLLLRSSGYGELAHFLALHPVSYCG
ncbi:Ankyrin repeat-containing domain protein, partial [Elaphomyces granulatus]